jgi:hypothetical protein
MTQLFAFLPHETSFDCPKLSVAPALKPEHASSFPLHEGGKIEKRKPTIVARWLKCKLVKVIRDKLAN